MTQVKIKNAEKSTHTKEELLEILNHHRIYARDIKDTRDGYVVIIAKDDKLDLLFGKDCSKDLQAHNYTASLPPQLKANRIILLFKLDDHIYSRDEEDISQEIQPKNDYTAGAISNISTSQTQK
ncbi:hypothetical protein E2C01_074869 [Portunus trituberculatus]|uniref:Uncharacterized protein n=1 Tax=Portunus trituberculatus TaxID=210409 RepID=A0A5B7I949_PORTR|nr:hypothetical protein [Portunus trituberculatus]